MKPSHDTLKKLGFKIGCNWFYHEYPNISFPKNQIPSYKNLVAEIYKRGFEKGEQSAKSEIRKTLGIN